MRLVAVTSLLFFCLSYELCAQDQEVDNEASIIVHDEALVDGLSVEDAVLLLESTKYTPTTDCQTVGLIFLLWFGCLLIDTPLVASLCVAGCLDPLTLDYTPTTLCKVGLSFMSWPFLVLFALPFYAQIGRFENGEMVERNGIIQTAIEGLRNNHLECKILYENEIEQLVSLIFKNPQCLKKINMQQAFVLYKNNPKQFDGQINKRTFNDTVCYLGAELSHLVSLSMEKLNDALRDQQTQDKLKEDPILLEMLIRFLPDELDDDINRSCLKCLDGILKDKDVAVRNLDAFRKSIKEGKNIEQLMLDSFYANPPEDIVIKEDSDQQI